MRTTRIYVDEPLNEQSELIATTEVRHYLVNVLRLKTGANVELFNGNNKNYTATISAIEKKSVTFSITHSTTTRTESDLVISLFQAISKGERMDVAIQKATELGVQHIYPWFAEFSAVKLDAARQQKRLNHWRDITINAAQQCERTSVPTLHSCSDLNSLIALDAISDAHKITLHPYNATATAWQTKQTNNHIVFLIGPEGGLSEREVKLAEQNGFVATQLGPRILRTETACISAVTMAQHLWGDLS